MQICIWNLEIFKILVDVVGIPENLQKRLLWKLLLIIFYKLQCFLINLFIIFYKFSYFSFILLCKIKKIFISFSFIISIFYYIHFFSHIISTNTIKIFIIIIFTTNYFLYSSRFFIKKLLKYFPQRDNYYFYLIIIFIYYIYSHILSSPCWNL